MCVLLDACIDPRVAAEIHGHSAATLFDLGWHRLKDAEVLLQAAGRLDVFVTADRGFEHQYNRTGLSFGIRNRAGP